MNTIVFIDSEISTDPDSGKILDLGAVKADKSEFHSSSARDFVDFVSGCDFICGHNIIAFDLKYIGGIFDNRPMPCPIDTLPLSPLLFPRRPYHSLAKDDKLQTDELNNPLNDAIKAMQLFFDEVNAFGLLPFRLKWIYCALLYEFPEFQGFFKYVGYKQSVISDAAIRAEFAGRLCTNADISALIRSCPVELAYTLAMIYADDYHSVMPPWVLKNYPLVEDVIKYLRNAPCADGCAYCDGQLDVRKELKRIFGFDSFRTYSGDPLQEKAADAAVHEKSLLAVFPTGGGKSLTFQLPALMAGEAIHGLTVVISPLQSLMKDQVDNLEAQGIVDAVTVNGMLSPIERSEALARTESGMANILYISPEQLRSKTIERLLCSRNIARFVIDEAHCFSAWGQDFRVDYLYIGDFIRQLQKKKGLRHKIPVSCFTATAKQKVISDICDYFKRKLNLDLELFTTAAARENLRYSVLYKETEDEKYGTLRDLIEQKNCPTIVYASRTRRTLALAEKLSRDGISAKPFNGKMTSIEKIANQEAFIRNDIKVIVATSAFGMGVDKKDVGLVVHYDISDSLENYVQESGRAGRDEQLEAECYVLFSDHDLDKHFILLNQTKLSISEIQQVWRAVKELTRFRPSVCCSALEVARQAGWDDSGSDIETRVKTAISALDSAGYLKRGINMPHVYATGILVKNMQEAGEIIDRCGLFDDKQRQDAKRIIKSLISSRSREKAGNDDAESRVDYLSDMLGIEKSDVIGSVSRMREANLLADSQDMSAFIHRTDSQNKSAQILEKFVSLEVFLLSQIAEEGGIFNLKELNERAQAAGISSSVKNLRTVLYYWSIKGCMQKISGGSDERTAIIPTQPLSALREKFSRRADICRFVVSALYQRSARISDAIGEEVSVQFSLIGLWRAYLENPQASLFSVKITPDDVEDALLYLSKVGSVSLEGGFFVLYNGMELKRLIANNKIQYKVDDYHTLSEFYKQKIQQIHIVGEYANLMVRDYDAALKFVQDYFQLDFKQFISKYFKGERAKDINRNITPEKYNQLFGSLSEIQAQIINDDESKYIVTTAGPGSGKTRVLVNKLAALLLLDDVKHEQLLMLTFSRAAATEFKKRLIDLIGNAAAFVDIKTFHSYCFDLLGKIGSLESVENVVGEAAQMIDAGEVETGRITKRVVVIDEAQDMDENTFALIKALIKRNDDMRIIAVGDDDQNIFEFRGSDSKYLRSLITEYGANLYKMLDNYRSKAGIVALANFFAGTIKSRIKDEPIRAVQTELGIVQLVSHTATKLEIPVVNQLISTYHGGTACVLTGTNDEALRVLGLLLRHGVRARLIQSNDGFKLYNLAEIRFFIMEIDRRIKSPVISDDIWNAARERLKSAYSDSGCLDICLNLLLDFEAISRTKYRTDLEEFIKESSYEDFYHDEKDVILVSTIHKSKGREFDAVYMLLSNMSLTTDANRRQVYVGLTRAKNELYIHYSGSILDRFARPGIELISDSREYPEADELILQLSLRDVFLGFSTGKKELILKLHSGAELIIDGEYFSAKIDSRTERVAKCSKACLSRIEELRVKGYRPYKAAIRFVVAWQGENDDAETAVILPDLYLKRDANG